LRAWEAGNQVMLQADCKGKGQSKKLSKKWTGPYTIIEVLSPQVVVLKEPNSRNWLTVNIGYTNHHNSWVTEEDLHANCLPELFQASRSSATTDRVRSTRLVGGDESSGFLTEFQFQRSRNSSQR